MKLETSPDFDRRLFTAVDMIATGPRLVPDRRCAVQWSVLATAVALGALLLGEVHPNLERAGYVLATFLTLRVFHLLRDKSTWLTKAPSAAPVARWQALHLSRHT